LRGDGLPDVLEFAGLRHSGKGAGVLRDKPDIKWDKDCGKDVESAPWYHVFKGERINDHHLTIEKKRNARVL